MEDELKEMKGLLFDIARRIKRLEDKTIPIRQGISPREYAERRNISYQTVMNWIADAKRFPQTSPFKKGEAWEQYNNKRIIIYPEQFEKAEKQRNAK